MSVELLFCTYTCTYIYASCSQRAAERLWLFIVFTTVLGRFRSFSLSLPLSLALYLSFSFEQRTWREGERGC